MIRFVNLEWNIYFCNRLTMNDSMKKKIIFIVNPISGTSSKTSIPKVIDSTINKELFDYEIKISERQGHASELASEAKDNKVDAVVAVGGDGTVNEVARAIVQSETALGVVPCGSGNGLARHLMIPLNLRKSIEIINSFEVHRLDYGVINDYPFFCTCGMGFDAFVSKKFADSGKRGPITYVESILKEGLKYRPETYTLEDESGTHQHKAFLISCANASQYGNNAYIAPQASMSDGLLDIVIMEPFDVLEAPQVSFDMFNKTLDMNSKIKTFKCKQLKVHRSKPGFIHYDGDPVMTGEDITVNMVGKGISVIVNPDGDKRKRRPNVIQTAFAELFNEFNEVRSDLTRLGKKV